MTKSELRKAYLAKRMSLSPEERAIASRRIAENFFNGFEPSAVRVLHCFVSIDKFNEINTRLIFERVWSEFPLIRTAVPRVNYETNELESVAYGLGTPMRTDRWGIGEPAHDDFVEPAEIDIVIVPLLCFDRQGHRVGYGKGYYDRFLSKCRPDCLKVGLSYFEPVAAIDDVWGGDVRLDFCATPDGVIAAAE